jgi:hypothetical protein
VEAKVSEVRHTSTEYVYRCTRTQKDGRHQHLEVRVVQAAGGKYWCEAVSDDGKTDTVGNAADSVREALSFVHWWELDEA